MRPPVGPRRAEDLLQAPSLRVTGGFYALQGACRRRSVRSARHRCGVRLAYAYARTDGYAVAYRHGDSHPDAGAHVYSYSCRYTDGHAYSATDGDAIPPATNSNSVPPAANSNSVPPAANSNSVADRNASTYRDTL